MHTLSVINNEFEELGRRPYIDLTPRILDEQKIALTLYGAICAKARKDPY